MQQVDWTTLTPEERAIVDEGMSRGAFLKGIFREGRSFIMTGGQGVGKTECVLSLMQVLVQRPDVHLFTNIVFHPNDFKYCDKPVLPSNVKSITNLKDCLIEICKIRIGFYESLTESDWRCIGSNKAVPGAPLCIILIDEAEGFISKFEASHTETYSFTEYFLTVIRKLGICLVLIYHEDDASVSALRRGGRMLAGELEKRDLKTVTLHLRDHPDITFGNMTITDMRYDSHTFADAEILAGGLDFKDFRNELKGVSQWNVPHAALKYLASLSSEMIDPRLIFDTHVEMAAYIHFLGLNLDGNGPPSMSAWARAFTEAGVKGVSKQNLSRVFMKLYVETDTCGECGRKVPHNH